MYALKLHHQIKVKVNGVYQGSLPLPLYSNRNKGVCLIYEFNQRILMDTYIKIVTIPIETRSSITPTILFMALLIQ